MSHQIKKNFFDCSSVLFRRLIEKFIDRKSLFTYTKVPILGNYTGEVIIEDCVSFASRIENLKPALSDVGGMCFYCLKVTGALDGDESCPQGEIYEIPSAITFDEFYRLGFDEMIDINGIKVYYFDHTFNWCIVRAIDIIYVTGPEDFVNNFFNSYGEKLEEVKTFIREYEDGSILDCPKETKDALRVIIDGVLYTSYEQIKHKLYPDWPGIT